MEILRVDNKEIKILDLHGLQAMANVGG